MFSDEVLLGIVSACGTLATTVVAWLLRNVCKERIDEVRRMEPTAQHLAEHPFFAHVRHLLRVKIPSTRFGDDKCFTTLYRDLLAVHCEAHEERVKTLCARPDLGSMSKQSLENTVCDTVDGALVDARSGCAYEGIPDAVAEHLDAASSGYVAMLRTMVEQTFRSDFYTNNFDRLMTILNVYVAVLDAIGNSVDVATVASLVRGVRYKGMACASPRGAPSATVFDSVPMHKAMATVSMNSDRLYRDGWRQSFRKHRGERASPGHRPGRTSLSQSAPARHSAPARV